MSRAERAFGLVDRRHEILQVLAEIGRAEFADAIEVAIGSLGHHGEFGGDGGEFASSHTGTLSRLRSVRHLESALTESGVRNSLRPVLPGR